MEKNNLKLEEKPNVFRRNSAKSTGGFDGNNVPRQDYPHVPYAPAPFPPNISRSNARIRQFFPDQIPTSGIDRMINSSHFNVSPIPNIELDSFGSISNALPQQRSSNRIWNTDTNMNHSHVESFPCRNFVNPRSTQNPTPLAAFPTHNPIENETFDAFQLNHPDRFGSFLDLGGVGNIGDSFENLDVFGSDVAGRSRIGALFQSNSTCCQTTSGTSIGYMNLSHNNTSHGQALHQELSGWNFAGNSHTSPYNSYMSSSPLSVFRRTQDGGPEVFFSRTPGNPAAPLDGNQFRLQDSQQNHSKDLSMASLFGSPNTRPTSLRLNEAGSGSYQYQLLDHAKTRGKNLSRVSLLGRHNSRLTSGQQSNEAGSAWNSSPQTSVFPCSPSLRVSESIINDDHSVGGVESRTGVSSHFVCRPSLKRGAVQPPRSAPRAQQRRQVIQLPGQPSNATDTVNTAQPIAETGPFLPSSSQTSTHNSAVHQMFQQPGPTFFQTARPCLPTSAHRIKWKVSDENLPIGKECFLCKRDVWFGPEGAAAVKPRNPPTVAVLPCGHVFHVKCLEETTPGEQSADPPCFPCAIGETPL